MSDLPACHGQYYDLTFSDEKQRHCDLTCEDNESCYLRRMVDSGRPISKSFRAKIIELGYLPADDPRLNASKEQE